MIAILIGVYPPPENLEVLQSAVTSNEDDMDWVSSCLAHDPNINDQVQVVQVITASMSPENFLERFQSIVSGECEIWASAPAIMPIKPSHDREYPIHNNTLDASIMRQWGIVTQSNVLDDATLAKLNSLVNMEIAKVETAIRQYHPQICIGKDVFLFREIASRSQERFDLRLDDTPAADFVNESILKQTCIQSFLQETLGSDIDFDVSVVYSRPGASHQGWHADGDHVVGTRDAGWDVHGWKNMADAYAICLFVPLIDLSIATGFTQFWPGSHCYRDLVGFGKVAELTDSVYNGIHNAGDGIWYDYRLLHRGMPNTTCETMRPVLQVIFKKKWYIERANYGTESICHDAMS